MRLQHARDGAFAAGDVPCQSQQNHKRAITTKLTFAAPLIAMSRVRSLTKLNGGIYVFITAPNREQSKYARI
jgi:hypothetical protein